MRIQWGYNGYHGYLTNDNPVGGLAALNFPDRQNPFGRKLLTWNGVKLGNRFRFWQVQMLCQWQDSAVIWLSYIYIYLLCRFFQQQTKIQSWTSWVCSLNSAICVFVCATVRLWLLYLPKITLPQFVRVCYLEAMAEKSFNDQSHDEPPRIRSEEAAERKAEKKLRQVPPGWYPHSWFLWMVIP